MGRFTGRSAVIEFFWHSVVVLCWIAAMEKVEKGTDVFQKNMSAPNK